eukprot:TRINITY_DN6057_c0_g1_i1.p1 TRINITY_DN6057_c0_g1~~TRINITY_DN6057_c0_g1_i1.p1  ORF type:complete len:271 (-),score=93.76 TRINITY_DN6057_c0_g1_i1:78-890(-)
MKIKEFLLEKKFDGWALITGASSGLGKEFARQLASKGFNCVITARREKEMEETKSLLESQFKVKVKVVAADLLTEEGVAKLIDEIKNIPIGLLINNAGFGYGGRFDKQDVQKLKDMVRLNCVVPLELTWAVLPAMKSKGGKSAVLFVSSASAFQPLPYHATYGASKAFLSSFGCALFDELKGLGIEVTVLEPGVIDDTGFQSASHQLNHHGAKSGEVVEDALVALEMGKMVQTFGWYVWLRGMGAALAPRQIVLPIARKIMLKQTPSHLM